MSTEYKQWYDSNKDLINHVKRERYKTDPFYRESILNRNKSYRQKASSGKALKARSWRVVEQPINLPDGTISTKQYYTIGYLASSLNCSVQALRSWEKDGLLPSADYKDNNGVRFYSQDTLVKIKDIVAQDLQVKFKKQALQGKTYKCLDASDGIEKDIVLYKFNNLQQICGKSRITLDKLIAAGHIPATPLTVTGRAHRLYTLEMMKAVAAAFKDIKKGSKETRWASFRNQITSSWEKLKINQLTIVTTEE